MPPSEPPPSDARSPAPGPDCLDDDTAVEFVEGLCTPSQVAAIEQHVDGCVPCRQLLSELARDSLLAPPRWTPGPRPPRRSAGWRRGWSGGAPWAGTCCWSGWARAAWASSSARMIRSWTARWR
ncbi:zf-HC2 domain-containing protein [Corallococcus sp. 4LFB]|uniref:zf-HC2 domain-containing protein n=1 Tax=Corallococcus sp. 4LFB TaxID=3383249 RepID=UPI003974BC6E